MEKKKAILTKKIKGLRKEIESHGAIVEKLEESLEKELQALAFSTWGVKIGGVVRSQRDGRIYRVTIIETRWMRTDGGVPWLRGCPKKKDGTWSDRIMYIYGDWEVVKE